MKTSFLNAWERILAENGNRIAITECSTGISCTFNELNYLAEQKLATFVGEKHRIIAFRRPNDISWLVLFLAIAKAGCASAPLDTSFRGDTLLSIIKRMKAWQFIDENECFIYPKNDKITAEGKFLIKLSSGSTGEPKSIAFSAEAMMADCKNIVATMGITKNDINYAILPLGHSYALGNLVMPLFTEGVPIVIGSGYIPRQMVDEIRLSRATILPTVPAVIEALSEFLTVFPDSVRLVISAGANLRLETIQRFYAATGLLIHNFYGSSETGGICYDYIVEPQRDYETVGKPLQNVLVSLTKTGRISVTSEAVHLSAKSSVSANGRSFILNDAGFINAKGEICLTGRIGRVVKIGGRRLDLQFVEKNAKKIEGIRDCYAFVQEGNIKISCAFESDLTSEMILKQLESKLSSWMMPRRTYVISSFPLTPRGKLDTEKLKSLLLNNQQ